MSYENAHSFPALVFAAQAAATVHSGDLPNVYGRGVQLVVDLTAVNSSSTVFTIEGKDEVSGKYYVLLTSAGLAANATTLLTVHPNIAASANVAVAVTLPRVWRVSAVVTGGTGLTGTVGANIVA
jgi:hypothetical protein